MTHALLYGRRRLLRVNVSSDCFESHVLRPGRRQSFLLRVYRASFFYMCVVVCFHASSSLSVFRELLSSCLRRGRVFTVIGVFSVCCRGIVSACPLPVLCALPRR